MPRQKKRSSESIDTQRAQMQTGFVNNRLFRQFAAERDDIGFDVWWHGGICRSGTSTKGELLDRYDSRNVIAASPVRLARRIAPERR